MCEVDIDDCTKDSCAHGVCIDRVNSFDCNCTNTGFNGRRCEEDIDECAQAEFNCVHGLCKNLPGSYECKCFQGGRNSKNLELLYNIPSLIQGMYIVY